MTIKRTPFQKVRFFSIIAFVVVLVGYSVFEMKSALFGVRIKLENASETVARVSDPLFPLSGLVAHAETFTINGRMVPIDQEGRFSDDIVLAEGYNKIELAARDRFGKEDTVELSVVFIR